MMIRQKALALVLMASPLSVADAQTVNSQSKSSRDPWVEVSHVTMHANPYVTLAGRVRDTIRVREKERENVQADMDRTFKDIDRYDAEFAKAIASYKPGSLASLTDSDVLPSLKPNVAALARTGVIVETKYRQLIATNMGLQDILQKAPVFFREAERSYRERASENPEAASEFNLCADLWARHAALAEKRAAIFLNTKSNGGLGALLHQKNVFLSSLAETLDALPTSKDPEEFKEFMASLKNHILRYERLVERLQEYRDKLNAEPGDVEPSSSPSRKAPTTVSPSADDVLSKKGG